MNAGKEVCEMPKSIREKIAEQYGLNYEPKECNHQGNCAGTSPSCDAELNDLQKQLEAKGIYKIEIDKRISEVINQLKEEYIRKSETYVTDGMPLPPDDIPLPGVPALEGDIKEMHHINQSKPRQLYKKCYIAGIGYHDIEDIWQELYIGARLALVRDKANKHDENAVAIALADDYDGNPDNFDFDCILGYVPRKENEHMAMMLDMGWSDIFECEISELNKHTSYKERIQVAIYIKSKDEVERSTKIRALSLNEESFDKMRHDLETKGYTYYRWGGFPIWQHNLPKKDDSVVFIHKGTEWSTLYIMHVIAVGDDAYHFVEDKEELYQVDDCCHYVFTNTMGPLKKHDSDLKFLDGENIDDDQPETFLSQEATDLLKGMFNE